MYWCLGSCVDIEIHFKWIGWRYTHWIGDILEEVSFLLLIGIDYVNQGIFDVFIVDFVVLLE